METNYLIHHGIKGQKWGVRRTAEQLGHKVGSPFQKRKNAFFKKRAEKKKQNSVKQEMTVEQKKEQVLKSRSASELYKNAHLFTTPELRSAYDRLQLERNIKNLSPPEISKGERFLKKLQGASGILQSSANAVDNASKFYNNVAKVFNSMNEDDDQLPIIGEKKEKPKTPQKTFTEKKEYTDPDGSKRTVTSTWKENIES